MRGFGIVNYRSFSSKAAWFPDLSKINIFIGKNNSGKSNILKFLRDISAFLKGLKSHGLQTREVRNWSEGDAPAIDLSVTMKELELEWRAIGIKPENFQLESSEKTRVRVRYDPVGQQLSGIDPFFPFQSNTSLGRRRL